MYEKLLSCVSAGDYESAIIELEACDFSRMDEELAILAATAFIGIGDLDSAYTIVREGLKINPQNYELYILLGQCYAGKNVNQAYLCYENALQFCSSEEDAEVIREFMDAARAHSEFDVRNVSIVILSYNTLDMTRRCIDSIRDNNLRTSYELVVVDNNSNDGSADWLKAQSDLVVQCNDYNAGFPAGCNQGILLAAPENDIFLLNNDTEVYPNSIFWLRMGLYDNEGVGAAGSMTNYACNGQVVNNEFNSDEDYSSFAGAIHIPDANAYERKSFLVGYALLLKRKVLDKVGLLDEQFTPGQFEDNDIGLRIISAGYQNILCHNSFIRHYGSGNGCNLQRWRKNYEHNKQLLKDKWKFNMSYYTYTRTELVDLITQDTEACFSVLEIGCGLGSTLNRIKYKYPNSKVYGIELVPEVAELGGRMQNIIQGNIENMELPYEEGQFDYIIFGDVLEHLHFPDKTLAMLKPYLADDGCFLCSIPNLMHVSTMYSLCHGDFEYEESGLLDKTHIHLFTLSSIVNMFSGLKLTIEDIKFSKNGDEKKPKYMEFMNWFSSLPGGTDTKLLSAYQFVFRARK